MTSTTYAEAAVVSREVLREYDADPRFASFVCGRARLACVLGQRQTWGVAGAELTVELALDKRVFYVLFIRAGWPTTPDVRRRKSLCLTEVYATSLTGEIRDFGGPELARFRVRALSAAGLITLAPVHLPELPADAPATSTATWAVIAELATIRTATGDTGPMPLVAPWLANWSGTPERTIRAGKLWLEGNGWIVHVRDAAGRFGNATKLWDVAGLARPSSAGRGER